MGLKSGALILVGVLALAGCGSWGGESPSDSSGPDLDFSGLTFGSGDNRCAVTVVFVNGAPFAVHGERNSTVTVNGASVRIGPDCTHTVTTTTAPPPEPA